MRFRVFLLGLPLLAGCAARGPEMTAGRTDDSAVMSHGKIWEGVNSYALRGPAEQFKNIHPELRRLYDGRVQGPGKASLLYDSRYLYVHAVLQDDDLIAESEGDQIMLSDYGDVFEVFLKPLNANYYWEIHISPKNQKLVIFYPGRGYHFLPCVKPQPGSPLPGLKSSVVLNGTLNQNKDKDDSWSVTVAVPLAEIAEQGIELKPGVPWKILLGRYNFSCHQPKRDLTAYPQLRFLDFHSHEEYADLILMEAK